MSFKEITKKSPELWSMQYLLLMLSNFTTSMSHFMFISLLPLYALSIGGNNTHAGMITGVYSLTALIFRPVFGRLLDRKGRRPVIFIGLSLVTLMAAAYIFCRSILELLLLRMINGIGFSAGSTAVTTVVADIIPPYRFAEGIGYFGLSTTFAQAIGPLLGLSLIHHHGYGVMLWTALGLSLLSILCAFPVKYSRKAEPEEIFEDKTTETKGKNGFLEAVLIWPALLLLLVSTSNGAVTTFIAQYALTLGIDNIGIFFTVFALGTMASRIGFGKLSNRFSLGSILTPAIIAVILSQIILSFASQLWIFILAAVLYGSGMGFILPILNTVVVLFASPDRKGEAVSVYYCALDIGIGGSAVVWGIVSQYFGFPVIYLSAAVSCFFALIVQCLFLCKRLKKI